MIDICVCCGESVPEGRMVCRVCELKYEEKPYEQYSVNWRKGVIKNA